MAPSTITVLAAAGPRIGLGHLSRAGAVAAALRAQGHRTATYVLGETASEHDGIAWTALGDRVAAPGDGPLLVDAYDADLATLGAGRPVATFWDGRGAPPAGVALALTLAGPEGPRLACLRPMFWGVAARPVAPGARRVLITTGGGAAGGVAELAGAVRAAAPEAELTAVLGPYATEEPPGDVTVVRSPPRMVDVLQAADVVVTAAGQTLLETLCAGTPCVALAVAENQRAQLAMATAAGAARAAAGPEDAGAAVAALLGDAPERARLASAGRSLVDGFGALRVAGAVAALQR
jgi:spore coat polysaccharide biosynthesis predicted glycosyltransferase SpsG